MIWYIPLEHIEMRYTVHLDRDIRNYLTANNIKFAALTPELYGLKPDPPSGMFLNPGYTCAWKSRQNALIAELFYFQRVKDGDVFWFSDLWHPGIESIKYMATLYNLDVKIKGIVHAGSWTDTDFVRLMERWAKNFEDMFFDIVDEVFVASEFIKKDMIQKRIINPDKVLVTGLPLDKKKLDLYKIDNKEDIIVFNGRNCDEKQPWLFEKMKENFSFKAWDFVNTQELNLPKDEYYKLLAKAKCVVSFALQENFGYGVNEAAYLGCIPVVPDRLVYPEYYDKKYRYKTFDEACHLVIKAMNNKLEMDLNTFDCNMGAWFK